MNTFRTEDLVCVSVISEVPCWADEKGTSVKLRIVQKCFMKETLERAAELQDLIGQTHLESKCIWTHSPCISNQLFPTPYCMQYWMNCLNSKLFQVDERSQRYIWPIDR